MWSVAMILRIVLLNCEFKKIRVYVIEMMHNPMSWYIMKHFKKARALKRTNNYSNEPLLRRNDSMYKNRQLLTYQNLRRVRH